MVKGPRVGKIGEPFTDLTKIWWIIMCPSRRSDVVSASYAQTSVSDYEKLCSTNILGLEESHCNQDELVFEKFKKQLNRSKEDWYGKGVIWRKNNIPLGNNKCESFGRLKRLLKNLVRSKKCVKLMIVSLKIS